MDAVRAVPLRLGRLTCRRTWIFRRRGPDLLSDVRQRGLIGSSSGDDTLDGPAVLREVADGPTQALTGTGYPQPARSAIKIMIAGRSAARAKTTLVESGDRDRRCETRRT